VDAAQAGLLTQALEFVGVPLVADGGAVLAYRDQTVTGPARAESLCFGLLAGLELIQRAGQFCWQWEVAANQQGVSVQPDLGHVPAVGANTVR
jgi:hypothetical protein